MNFRGLRSEYLAVPGAPRDLHDRAVLPEGWGMFAANAGVHNARPHFDRPEDRRLEAAVLGDDAAAIGEALRSGADANAEGQYRLTPLMIAVGRQKPNAVNALLRSGADPNAIALDRQTPVTLAVERYRAQPDGRRILVAVLERDGDANARRPDGDPVIMQFVLDHAKAGLGLMKTMGANLNILDRAGDPLITRVAMSQDWDMVWALIELGAEVDYENGKSTQPLSKALSRRYPSPDSPLHVYKLRVWQLLQDQGLPVQPLKP
jgi:ankyrin repeat protein